LYGYIFAVVRNWEDADDLYQAVCLILWRKFESFQPGTSFFAWARQTARIEVSKHLREKKLPRPFSEQLVEDLAESVAASQDADAEPYLTALRHCKTKLPRNDEELLELHYGHELGSRQIADQLKRSQASICRSLNRIRCWLLNCVQMEIVQQEHSEYRPHE
jgi:RNA polymerase sigma-70 factor (ECF subfamily)